MKGHKMKSTVDAIISKLEKGDPPRCSDCDAYCWLVQSKAKCWAYDAEKGFCPWLHPGLEFPPKPNT